MAQFAKMAYASVRVVLLESNAKMVKPKAGGHSVDKYPIFKNYTTLNQGIQPIQKAIKFKVKNDQLGLTGLYYRARDSCHADFIAQDLFAFKQQERDCKEIEGEIYYHCRKNFTIYQSKGMYLVAKVNVQSQLG